MKGMATVLTKFDHWKQFLGDRVEAAKKIGLSEETISKLAFEIGEFLDQKVDPKNDEERVLKELWDVGDTEERKTIARLMVKLAENKA
jgi:RAB protein geranylgeranyltransferase component A